MSGVAVMGIDPGLGGGIAILDPHNGLVLEPMPVVGNELDLPALANIFREWASETRVAYLEKVHAMPGQGVSSMFKFGKVYGAIEALLIYSGISTRDVRPQVWMKEMHQGVASALKPKERSLLAFQRLFPGVDARRTLKGRKADEGLVDAALIAEFGRRQP